MQHIFVFIFTIVLFVCVLHAAPVDNKDVDTNKDSKSAFGPAFDEIVVESHLTVRRKSNNNARQGRTQNTTKLETGVIKTKREIKLPIVKPKKYKSNILATPQFGASSSAQSQSFNSFGPLGSFGASASSSQSQNFGFGPNGLIGGAGFSGTQQYNFNGQTIDIAFGASSDGKNNGGAVVTITGPDGKKRPFRG